MTGILYMIFRTCAIILNIEQSILIIIVILMQTMLLKKYLTINLKINLSLFDIQYWLSLVKEYAFVNLQLLFFLNMHLLIEYNSNIFSFIVYKRVDVMNINIWLTRFHLMSFDICSNWTRFLFYKTKLLTQMK